MRTRLLDAFQTLLARKRLKSLTVKGIAERAQTTHATFYRYFADIHDILITSVKLAQQSLPSLDLHVTGTFADERSKIARLIEGIFSAGSGRAWLLRAFIEARDDSRVLQALWQGHCERLQLAWSTYIRELNEFGFGRSDDSERLAEVVVLCLQARLEEAILRGKALSPAEAELWTSVTCRMILHD